MGDCLEPLKERLGSIVGEHAQMIDDSRLLLQNVWRVRLLPFRVIGRDDVGLVEDFPFCATMVDFRGQLGDSRCTAGGGGEGPRSALDALFSAVIRSEWRPETEAHRFVILFTDAQPCSTLHPVTADGGPDDVSEVRQVIRIRRAHPVFLAPRSPELEAIYGSYPSGRRADASKTFPLFATAQDARDYFMMDTREKRDHFARGLAHLTEPPSFC